VIFGARPPYCRQIGIALNRVVLTQGFIFAGPMRPAEHGAPGPGRVRHLQARISRRNFRRRAFEIWTDMLPGSVQRQPAGGTPRARLLGCSAATTIEAAGRSPRNGAEGLHPPLASCRLRQYKIPLARVCDPGPPAWKVRFISGKTSPTVRAQVKADPYSIKREFTLVFRWKRPGMWHSGGLSSPDAFQVFKQHGLSVDDLVYRPSENQTSRCRWIPHRQYLGTALRSSGWTAGLSELLPAWKILGPVRLVKACGSKHSRHPA